MTDPKPERRGYYDANGKRLPSVTTVIGATLGWSKDGLVGWAYRKGVEAMADEMTGPPPPSELGADADDEAIMGEWVATCAERAKAKRAHQKQRDAAADAGTLAHAMIEAHQRGEPLPSSTDPVMQAAATVGYRKWLRWYIDVDPELIAAETLMVDQAIGLGGTLDSVVRIGAKVVLADWKTGKGAYDDVVIQLGGYAHLWEQRGGAPIDEAVVVNAPCAVGAPLDVVRIDLEQLREGRAAFFSLLSIYKARPRLALRRQ